MIPPHDTLPGQRFGLIADTHSNLVDWPAALASIKTALGQVDGIIHCGDLGSADVLRDLGQIAPVLATRSGDDPPAQAPLLVDGERTFEAGDLRLGVVFSLDGPPTHVRVDPAVAFTTLSANQAVTALFGAPPVDVCVFGGTHQAAVAMSEGILFINPGSPTLAKQRTVAILTVENGCANVEIVPVG